MGLHLYFLPWEVLSAIALNALNVYIPPLETTKKAQNDFLVITQDFNRVTLRAGWYIKYLPYSHDDFAGDVKLSNIVNISISVIWPIKFDKDRAKLLLSSLLCCY